MSSYEFRAQAKLATILTFYNTILQVIQDVWTFIQKQLGLNLNPTSPPGSNSNNPNGYQQELNNNVKKVESKPLIQTESKKTWWGVAFVIVTVVVYTVIKVARS